MMALIRVPRDLCNMIRSSLTLLPELQSRRIAISVLSVKGSARTAKIDSIRKVQYLYRQLLTSLMARSTATKSLRGQRELDQTCRSMEKAIETISNIDY
jgi:Rpp14/Pop5 family